MGPLSYAFRHLQYLPEKKALLFRIHMLIHIYDIQAVVVILDTGLCIAASAALTIIRTST